MHSIVVSDLLLPGLLAENVGLLLGAEYRSCASPQFPPMVELPELK